MDPRQITRTESPTMRSLMTLMLFKLLSQDAVAGAAPATAPAAAPAAEAKPEQIKQNGVIRPGEGTKCLKIWEVADAISTKENRPAKRAEVINAALALEINPATASTQYGRWHKFWGLPNEPRVPPVRVAAANPDGSEKPAKAKKGKKAITVSQGNAALDAVAPEAAPAPAEAAA